MATQMIVEVKNDDINRAIKDLKRRVFKEKILIEYKQHMAYEKPSERRRRKRAEAVLRCRKEQQEIYDELWS